jgi:superfamily II DNA or RNA helicase
LAPDIEIYFLNHSKVKLRFNSEGIARELSEHFTFEAPNFQYHPSYKKRFWDGKIRLFDSRTSTIGAGLVKRIIAWANDNNYTVINHTDINVEDSFSLHEAKEFVDSLNLPLEPREYQLRAFALAIRNKRLTLISPTGSGKSLIIYLIARYLNLKTLIVVPSISLVAQLSKDFMDYGYEGEVHGVMAGVKKVTDLDFTVSTWQSIVDQPGSFFDDYGLIMVDEAHGAKSKSLISIMDKSIHTEYRFGLTGTLDGSDVNELTLNSLFGPTEKIITASELIDNKTLAEIQINVLVLKHHKKHDASWEYNDEISYLVSNEARNKFIRNLALSLKGNTLILFALVENHGRHLHEMLRQKDPINCHFIAGEIKVKERETIRGLITSDSNIKLTASYGTFQQGIDAPYIDNIIFGSPSKSKIRVLQSIGRGLRRPDGKTSCILFDIADDISGKNYTLSHMGERIKHYSSENFPYKIHSIELKEKKSEPKLF